jgi:hypothetical protein
MKSAVRFGAGALIAAATLAGCAGGEAAFAPNSAAKSGIAGWSPSEVGSVAEAAPPQDRAPSAAAPTAGWGAAEASKDAASQPESEARASRDRGVDPWRLAPEPSSAPRHEPGLGTSWGETRASRVSSAPFERADEQTPFAVGSLFYNDADGVRASIESFGRAHRSAGAMSIGDGAATVRLRDGSGRFLSGFEAAGRSFVVGEHDARYSIVVESHVPASLEVVVSVDGLDVLDGRPASFDKRGYLLEPHGRIEIDGFRQSFEEVAAFRFGSVRDSYAEQKHGDSRNVGVIGVAVFHERGSNPRHWRLGHDRLDANPFPGTFATPPGR